MPDREDHVPNEIDGAPMASTAEVAAVVNAVQRKHRGKIRWSLGKHTAEMALKALEGPVREGSRRPSSKSRRRKRHKRLL